MRFAKSWQNSLQNPLYCLAGWVGAWVVGIALVCILSGCYGTVTPQHVHAGAYSWDGTNFNSGFIAWTNGGAIITPHAADRYNELMTQYGSAWKAKPNDGLTLQGDGSLFIDDQHLSYFATANRWHKEGKK